MKTVFSMRSISQNVVLREEPELNDTRIGFSEAVWGKQTRGIVSQRTLCETEVRASQSEPICLSRARGRRVACLKVPALGSGGRTAIDTPRSVYLRPRSTSGQWSG